MPLALQHKKKVLVLRMQHFGRWPQPLHLNLRRVVKFKGVTYAQLVEKLDAIGISDKEVNVANTLSRGKFSATFMLACLKAIETEHLHLV
jgi:hypothetical protein